MFSFFARIAAISGEGQEAETACAVPFSFYARDRTIVDIGEGAVRNESAAPFSLFARVAALSGEGAGRAACAVQFSFFTSASLWRIWLAARSGSFCTSAINSRSVSASCAVVEEMAALRVLCSSATV